MSILAENDNTSDHFMYYKEEKYLLGNKGEGVREDQKDSVGTNSENKSVRDILPRRISQAELFGSELSSCPKEVRFCD